jgi:hypothetical protein
MTTIQMTPQELHQLAKTTDTKIAELQWKHQRLMNDRTIKLGNIAYRIYPQYKPEERTAMSVFPQGRYRNPDLGVFVNDEMNRLESSQWDREQVAGYLTEIDEINNNIKIINEELRGLHEVYAQHEWSRFYLVVASNGHIHHTTSCHTCYETTQFTWVTELSGLTEQDAVTQEGEILCSICFPTAPVNWTTGVGRRIAGAREERERKKQERLEKKLAKALLPTGQPLRVVEYPTRGWTTDLSTLAAAKKWLTGHVANRSQFPDFDKVVDAVANKENKTTDDVIAEALKRYRQRR